MAPNTCITKRDVQRDEARSKFGNSPTWNAGYLEIGWTCTANRVGFCYENRTNYRTACGDWFIDKSHPLVLVPGEGLLSTLRLYSLPENLYKQQYPPPQ